MVETMNNLKNNRVKTGIAASNIASDHIIRMKKTLGTLNTQSIRGIEPLRVGLEDLRDSEKRGKWWLVGASYKDKTHEDCNQDGSNQRDQGVQLKGENETLNNTSTDLIQLAREQRMNTDVRRSIFVAIMSATDYKDAHNRISKLRLKKNQELEIPRVLIHCASAEENYNPFYSLISRRVCSERKLKMAFQFSLWNLFKRMGEDRESKQEDPDDDEDKDDELQLRSIVNLAKLFGVLIAEDGLGIGVLKVKSTVQRYVSCTKY
jgi:nucleolar MIF4G domain-containing protein 1